MSRGELESLTVVAQRRYQGQRRLCGTYKLWTGTERLQGRLIWQGEWWWSSTFRSDGHHHVSNRHLAITNLASTEMKQSGDKRFSGCQNRQRLRRVSYPWRPTQSSRIGSCGVG